MKAAIIGGGVIGGGWAARFLLNGHDVDLLDPDRQAARRTREVIDNARRSLPALYDRALPPEGNLTVADSLEAAVEGADWVQESVPERLELKHAILGQIGAAAPPQAITGSSTSGFRPSQLNEAGARAIVAHPFNPVYLLPLVELSGDAETCTRAAAILETLGMYPLVLGREIDAHIADRLLEAVWREALWLVNDGIASTAEIDEAIRMGFGLRWAQMGLFETYRIAGGEAGMRHFLAQFGPALAWPWSRLTDVPDLTPELVGRIAGQSDAQSGGMSVRDLERLRDGNLVAILRALKQEGAGAGRVLAAHEAALPAPEETDPAVTVDRRIPGTWTDYNGHMNEARYLEAGAQATDRFLETAGAGPDYVATGFSYFTAESHICYLAELNAGARLRVTTRVLAAEGRRLHLFHEIAGGEGTPATVAATVETLLLHVDLATRKSCQPPPHLAATLGRLATRHARLPHPVRAGRHVGQRPPPSGA